MTHNQDWLEWLLLLNAIRVEYVIVGGVDRDPTQGPPLMGFWDSSFIRPHVKPSP